MFLRYIHKFRGIAILFVVAGHCYGLSSWHIDTFAEKAFVTLISGGSVLFVFISGFLFHHVFFKKFHFRTFMTKKIQNVLTPYLLLSIAPIIYLVFFKGAGMVPYSDYLFLHEDGIYYQYLRPIILYLWSGSFMTAYWYIPFIMIMFLMSPLFVAFIKLNPTTRILSFFIMLMIAVFIHRPVGNLYPLQSVVYFSPVYAYGILASIHWDAIYRYLKGKELYMLGLTRPRPG